MSRFFTVLFGGLFAVGAGFAIAYGAPMAWNYVRPYVSLSVQMASSAISAASIEAQQVDASGTAIAGIRKIIRYTASEEEDLINAAALSLPQGIDGSVTGRAYLVKNLATNEIVAEKNADQVLPIASITKLATAVVARKLIDPDERILIGPKIMSTYGNTAGFKNGEVFKASDMLYPLLMVSSNDAAEAFALAYGREDFLRAMNDWAQNIGAYRTYFDDASGLSPHNVSSATDIAIMLDWIRQNDPEILDITLTKSKTVRSHTWVNPTHFLSWSHYIGGKNGFTDEANRTTAALFAIGANKHPYVVVALGSDNRDSDVIRLLAKVRE